MKLFIKQHVFSWKDRFSVMDEEGRDRYFVEGEFFSFGKKLHVYNAGGQEVVYIEQKMFSFLPKFYIYIGEEMIAEVVKELTFFAPRYTVSGLGWDVEGEFFAHEYEVLEDGDPIVSISKEWFTWGDSYVLDIADEQNELPALAVMLAIDCAMAQGKRASH